MSSKIITNFQQTVLSFYRQNGRVLAWRVPEATGHFDPYKIIVSEIMLQQTQVSRVTPKYQEFLELFPDVEALAQASLADVLRAWAGLGYYRRARYLHEAAQIIAHEYAGKVPSTQRELTQLPGIGTNTASAVLVYAFNQPQVFIETNIRTVFIHHFFKHEVSISDAQLMPYIQKSLFSEDPRKWYWAIMDYGSFLKQGESNPGVRSKSYTKQATFKGSVRLIRGQVLKELTSNQRTLSELKLRITDKRLPAVLEALKQDGLISEHQQTYFLGR